MLLPEIFTQIRSMQDTSVFRTDVRQVFDLMMLYSKSAHLVKKRDYLRKDGKVNMCRGLVEWARQEREAGEAKGIQQGISQGITKGIAQGADQEKEATIKAALEMNLPVNQIAQICRCFEERVLAFRERQVL